MKLQTAHGGWDVVYQVIVKFTVLGYAPVQHVACPLQQFIQKIPQQGGNNAVTVIRIEIFQVAAQK